MTDATPAPTSCRKLRLALMASLALNVLIIGAVAGTLCFSRLGRARVLGGRRAQAYSVSRIRCRASAPI